MRATKISSSSLMASFIMINQSNTNLITIRAFKTPTYT